MSAMIFHRFGATAAAARSIIVAHPSISRNLSASSSSSLLPSLAITTFNLDRFKHKRSLLNVKQQQQESMFTTFLQAQSRRFLFTNEVLGVDRFVDFRNRVRNQFGQHKEKFLERLQAHLAEEGTVVLSEDLKNLIFLCDGKPEEVDLLFNVIQRFEKQNESLKFGTFQFGPVVMRMAYHLTLPDVALKLMDKQYIHFFSQISSVTIAMDLLFNAGRYDEVLQLFNFVQDNYQFELRYPIDAFTLYMGSCYKLNTVDSFDQAFRLLREIKMNQTIVKMRSICFFLTLAVNVGQPNIALEIIQQLSLRSSLLIQSIRLRAFADIGRFQDVCDILRYQLRIDRPQSSSTAQTRAVCFGDAFDQITEKINQNAKPDMVKEFANIVKQLNESGLIERARTLDDALMEPLVYIRKKDNNNVDGAGTSQRQQQQRNIR